MVSQRNERADPLSSGLKAFPLTRTNGIPLLLLHLDSAREREISAFHRNLIQRTRPQECTFDTRGARNWSTRSLLPTGSDHPVLLRITYKP